jgi:hypothetical protein
MSTERKAGVRIGATALAAVLAALIAGCGGDDASPSPAPEPPAAVATVAIGDVEESATESKATGGSNAVTELRGERARPESATGELAVPPESEPASSPKQPSLTRYELTVPAGAHGIVWVRRGAKVRLRTEPGGGRVAKVVGRRTEFGSPTVLGVVKQVDGWAGVTTPYLPNGQLAWLRLNPNRIDAGWTRLEIEVDLGSRSAALRDGHRVLRSFSVTVGAPGVETPTGRFAVTDTFRGDLDPAAYGCCALALSAIQPHLPSGWLGGNRIAIHGTTGPLGIAASHGCVRAGNDDVSALVDRVPLGTPVFIHS